MISPLAKVMGLKSRNKLYFARHRERDYRHKKVIRHVRSGNIIHTTYYFTQRKSNKVYFFGSPGRTKKINFICQERELLISVE